MTCTGHLYIHNTGYNCVLSDIFVSDFVMCMYLNLFHSMFSLTLVNPVYNLLIICL